MFLWLMLILFVFLTTKVSYWFSIGLIFFGVLKAYGWYRYNGRPWRKIHYKAMILYSAAAGEEMAMSRAKNVEFNLRNALISFAYMLAVRDFFSLEDMVFPEKIVDREFERIEKFADRPLIKEHFSKVFSKKSHLEELVDKDVMIENFLNEMQSGIKENYNSLMVRLIIAAAIEHTYSPADRGEYLYEYFMGNVN